jgi:hypothetical protein
MRNVPSAVEWRIEESDDVGMKEAWCMLLSISLCSDAEAGAEGRGCVDGYARASDERSQVLLCNATHCRIEDFFRCRKTKQHLLVIYRSVMPILRKRG